MDGDGDGWMACEECDDTLDTIHPGAPEICNGLDDDCNGVADDGPPACADCEVELRDGVTYLFCIDPVTWEEALDLCDDFDFHLVTIDDVDEDTFLSDTAASIWLTYWWMGFNDRDQEGTWVWQWGSSPYTHWDYGEPNNAGDEDCGTLLRYYPATVWNDVSCTGWNLPFVCESE